MSLMLYKSDAYDRECHTPLKDMSVLKKFKSDELEVDTYIFRKGTQFFIDPPVGKGVKTYSIVKGRLKNYETGLFVGIGDIIKVDVARSYLHFEVESDSTIIVHALRSAVYDGWQCNESATQDILDRIQFKDQYTGVHCEHVFRYVTRLARRMGMHSDELYHLHKAARFHDIGKIFIDDGILNKRGDLSKNELERMKSHVKLGREIILRHFPVEVFDIISLHHERMDGSGYPNGLHGDDIPLAGRILAVCDCYDAIVTDRVYKKGKHKRDAISELMAMTPHKLDRRVVEVFIEVLGHMADEEAEMAERRRRMMPPGKRIVTE